MSDHRTTPRPAWQKYSPDPPLAPASFVWADNDEMQAEPSPFGTYPVPERRRTVGHKMANLLRRLADYVEYRWL